MSSENPTIPALNYDPSAFPRELKRHYISASDEDIASMLAAVGASSLSDLYSHIPADCRFADQPELPKELSYDDLQARMVSLSEKNRICESFLGDGLPHYEVGDVVNAICSIRNLTTAYTPYQPERSQGTLMTHWIYQCLMSQITGFEGINSSLYERSTAIFEAITTAVRLSRKADTVIISEGIYPGDREVIETLRAETEIEIIWIPLQPETGLTHFEQLKTAIAETGDRLAGVVFPQVNSLGLLEPVDELTNLIKPSGALSIAVIDPALLGTGGLKPPTAFGDEGVDIIVGEAQHLAIGPNFGGPGLGLFGVRHNEKTKNIIRQTPGRFVGRAKDLDNRECLVMVLSTREQHIRKDKATSNICSNQAFLATIAGASLLVRGEEGMKQAFTLGRDQAKEAATSLTRFAGVSLAYPEQAFVNELLLKVPSAKDLIKAGREQGIHLGVDISNRIHLGSDLIKISFSDRKVSIDKLTTVFEKVFGSPENESATIASIPTSAHREGTLGLPQMKAAEVIEYYNELGRLNVSPDSGCYPLGSCTMKYNPYINDWAASLTGFTDIHPQAPIEDAQGSLEILYETQEWFKAITGLPGITTQPVAGAQGELVGIKLFQAYHRDRGETKRDVVLIPASAHGTNFATAAMAGFKTQKIDGLQVGIVLLESNSDGKIDMEDFNAKIDQYREHISGIMITNPNTCGIFETDFKTIADKIHEVGGLVYMDGANMNAIAGWCNLGAMGVDAVHNNLHKTWTIPHGGGGPGDAIVGVSERLLPYLPGYQIEKQNDLFVPLKAEKSIGSFHRHWGNFAHKVRAFTYLLRLGKAGVPRMTAFAVLSARYSFEKLRVHYPSLPAKAQATPRMHEFILTLEEEDFNRIEAAGVPKALAITRIGKLFLDFGFHAPTVAWPETLGLMIEPTESYTMAELDRFCEAVIAIRKMIKEHPEVLNAVPLFTPVDRVDDVTANRQLQLFENIKTLPKLHANRMDPTTIAALPIETVYAKILEAAKLSKLS